MKTHELIPSGLLELYTAGITLPEEKREVEYLLSYPEIIAELEKISAVLQMYAQSFALRPSPAVKEKVVEMIRQNFKYTSLSAVLPVTDAAKLVGVSSYWRSAAAASITLLIGSIALHLVNYNKSSALSNDLAVTQQNLASLKAANKEIENNLAVVQSKYSVPVALKGVEAAADAAAKIFWMKNTGEVFIDASNLPLAPAGKQYQLWGIVDGRAVDGGMLVKNQTGNQFRMQKMKNFGKAEAFVITLEPEKGNLAPQGSLVVMGKV